MMSADLLELATLNAPIESERLLLDPLSPEHSGEAWEGLRDPRLYSFVPVDPPPDVEALARRFARLASRRSPDGSELWLNWLGREKGNRRAVGTFEATVTHEAARSRTSSSCRSGAGVWAARESVP